MATRSTIAMEFEDGSVKQVYCHWDGYLDHNGRILQEHYTDPAKLQALIEQGSISSLDKEIGLQHPFSPHDSPDAKAAWEAAEIAGWTTFCARDRGEDLRVNTFWDFDMYRLSAQCEEFNYILRKDGAWYVSRDSNKSYSALAPLL